MKFKSKQYGKYTVLVSDKGNIFTGKTGHKETFREKFFYFQPERFEGRRIVINLRELYQDFWVNVNDTSEILELNTAEFFKSKNNRKEIDIPVVDFVDTVDMSVEQWKSITNELEVSNYGRMREYGINEEEMNGEQRYSINTKRNVAGSMLIYKTFRPDERVLGKLVRYKDGNTNNCRLDNLQYLYQYQIDELNDLEYKGPTVIVPKDIFEKLINFNRKIMVENTILRNKLGITAVPEKIIQDIYDLYDNLK
jgi:hypothetical protein